MFAAIRRIVQLEVGPDRADEAERHVDPEHQPPVGVGEQAADQEADELAADRRDDVDAEREAALVLGERVGEQSRGIGHDQRTADTLDDAHGDQIGGGEIALARQQAERDGSQGEDGEAEIVHACPAELIAQAAERHH